MRQFRDGAADVTYPAEKQPHMRCKQTITLHGITYQCARTKWHEGAHDAHDSDPDGLVRW